MNIAAVFANHWGDPICHLIFHHKKTGEANKHHFNQPLQGDVYIIYIYNPPPKKKKKGGGGVATKFHDLRKSWCLYPYDFFSR